MSAQRKTGAPRAPQPADIRSRDLDTLTRQIIALQRISSLGVLSGSIVH
jgi:hypothetical protein